MFKPKSKVQKATIVGLSLLLGASALGAKPALSAPGSVSRKPVPATVQPAPTTPCQQDTLLLMANPGSGKDDISKALEEVHGTVVGTMGRGDMQILIVRTEKGKLAETEKKLLKDKKDFSVVQRNHLYSPGEVPNDPDLPKQWHLNSINAQQAWNWSHGSPVPIAIFDSGCQASINELAPTSSQPRHILSGYDAMDSEIYKHAEKHKEYTSTSTTVDDLNAEPPNKGAATDPTGHGTLCATVAGAVYWNKHHGAGIAPEATIYPVHITIPGNSGDGDDIGMVAGLLRMMKLIERESVYLAKFKAGGGSGEGKDDFKNVPPNRSAPKIVNISFDLMPTFEKNEVLQRWFKRFHDYYGGLIFACAGNDGSKLSAPKYPYLQVISAIDRDRKLADFSNYGSCITLAAPGDDIVCTDRQGVLVSVDGTSLASPIVAGIAALVWACNPRLTNTQVEKILQETAHAAKPGFVSSFYGYGIVDAEGATKKAYALADPRGAAWKEQELAKK
jgi:thermitase